MVKQVKYPKPIVKWVGGKTQIIILLEMIILLK